jgi:uncharacterized protein with GYD domain
VTQTFIVLVKMTNMGRIEFAESLKRGEIGKKIMARNGVEMTDYYFTLGRCDVVLFFEAQTNAGMAQTMAELGRLGAIETETLMAFGQQDYAKIMDRMAETKHEDISK